MKPWSPNTAILLATAYAGTLDILAAFLLAGWAPVKVLHGVASALLGPEAAELGWISAAFGLALHYSIMLVMAGVFVGVSGRFAWLQRHPVPSGLGYGVVLWMAMNLIVLPLRWPALFPRIHVPGTLGDMASHLFFVGLTIALCASRVRRA